MSFVPTRYAPLGATSMATWEARRVLEQLLTTLRGITLSWQEYPVVLTDESSSPYLSQTSEGYPIVFVPSPSNVGSALTAAGSSGSKLTGGGAYAGLPKLRQVTTDLYNLIQPLPYGPPAVPLAPKAPKMPFTAILGVVGGIGLTAWLAFGKEGVRGRKRPRRVRRRARRR